MTSHKKEGHIKPDELQMWYEEMTAWEDWIILQVHAAEKPDRYGMVSKSKSGYIYYNMEVSNGKSQPVKIWV